MVVLVGGGGAFGVRMSTIRSVLYSTHVLYTYLSRARAELLLEARQNDVRSTVRYATHHVSFSCRSRIKRHYVAEEQYVR